MATPPATTRKLSLKLLVDTSSSKVLFAEAGKDFIDFLLSLLALPVGTIIQLLSEERMVGSLGKLHSSLKALSSNYIQPGFDKGVLLHPRLAVEQPRTCLLLGVCNDPAPECNCGKKFYYCNSCCHGLCLTDCYKLPCPNCRRQMTASPTILTDPDAKTAAVASPAATEGGYVKGVVTYMVMDDLDVRPMSTISSITFLNKFHVKDVGVLEERMVEIDMVKGLKLLEVSLYSTSVLTDVLLEEGGQ